MGPHDRAGGKRDIPIDYNGLPWKKPASATQIATFDERATGMVLQQGNV